MKTTDVIMIPNNIAATTIPGIVKNMYRETNNGEVIEFIFAMS